MTNKAKLLESIATIIADYRQGELPKPTPEHVEKWVDQFGDDVQIPLLQELAHVLGKIYFDKAWVVDFLTRQIGNQKFAGTTPCEYWKDANFLRIQLKGHSQEEMLGVLEEGLQAQCGLSLDDCGSENGPYIYLDDALFSGFRVGDDLSKWLNQDAPAQGTVHILVIASHKFGEWRTPKRLNDQAKECGKTIKFDCWRAVSIENRRTYSKNSEVLWPAVLPDDPSLKAYMAEQDKHPFEPRQQGGTYEYGVFSSEEGRQILEREMLLAGLRIRSLCADPSPSMRPLGFSPFGLGFGSMIVTFRNCPNNCPLALWWGNPDEDEASPLSKWYPLLPRKTYGDGNGFGET